MTQIPVSTSSEQSIYGIGPTGFFVFLGVVASVATLLAVADMRLSRCCPEGTEMAHA
jgi:hypothetical protein